MSRYMKLSDKWIKILQILLLVSVPCLTLFFSRHCTKLVLISTLIASLIITFFAIKKISSINTMYKRIDLFVLFVSALFTNYIMKYHYASHFIKPFSKRFYSISHTKLNIVVLFASFALLNIIYFIIKTLGPKIIKFFKGLTKCEKKYLAISTLGSFILLCVVYNMTSAFYYVENISWDIIYTTDSSHFYQDQSFLNMGSIVAECGHAPLITILALPFTLLSKILSSMFFMLPNADAIFMVLVHTILLNIMIIMLARLMKLEEKNKILFYIFFLCTFSTISFYIILEKFIFAAFYAVLCIYTYYNLKKDVNYSYIGATGLLTTSGILLPFISKRKTFKKKIIDVLKCFGLFLAIIIVSGQFPQNLELISRTQNSLNAFSGVNVSFNECFMQYLNFVKGIFLALPAHVDYVLWHYGYLIDNVYNYSKIGILVLIVCAISIIINRKNKMALISGFWILFSFIVLCVIGWGTFENGLNLYSLYFSYAYIILIYLFIDKIFKSQKVKVGVIILICICLLVINIPEFINIVKFGIEYYPV